MYRRIAVQHAVLVVIAGVDLRMCCGGVDQRADQERQQRQMLALGMGLVEYGAQFLDRSDIDLLDIGEMRDLPLRFLQTIGTSSTSSRRAVPRDTLPDAEEPGREAT